MDIGSGSGYPSSTLTHSMGKSNESKTILTKNELCSWLMKLRTKLQNNK